MKQEDSVLQKQNNNMELEKIKRESENGTFEQMEMGSTVVKKTPYPKGVFFIMATELSERFSYYGMRAVLTIYMRNILSFSENAATSYYHVFLLLCYGLPIFWGIISDSWLGKFKTILYVSILFALGNIILTLSSIPHLHLPTTVFFFIGLILMAVGTGGMKPCVAPLGGEQYVLPEQSKQLEQFFSIFFFVVTIGNMISTVITPIFRRDVSCFEMENCFPLAFGVPASIMILAIVIFLSGKSLYKITKPNGNMLVKVTKCVAHAISNRRKKRSSVSSVDNGINQSPPSKGSRRRHWLDSASDQYDERIIADTKGLFRILPYFLPVPMFFALYEQLGSRWTLQATRMNGRVGSFAIKPDQMQVSNAILMFFSLPFFNYVVYPLCHKCGIRLRTLQKMVIGGLLAAASFSAAGIVNLKIEPSIKNAPSSDNSIITLVNNAPCPVVVTIQQIDYNIKAKSYFTLSETNFSNLTVINVKSPGSEGKCGSAKEEEVPLIHGAYQSIIISHLTNGSLSVKSPLLEDDYKKSKDGNARVRFIYLHEETNNSDKVNIKLTPVKKGDSVTFSLQPHHPWFYTETEEVPDDEFKMSLETQNQTFNLPKTIAMRNGGSYNLIVYQREEQTSFQLVTITPANDIHILWLLPQYTLMAWGEILFIVSGMEFAYTEAPLSMKSVVQAIWHLMNAVGNLIVIISAQNHGSQSTGTLEFFIFSGLMFVDSVVYFVMARRYKYVNVEEKSVVAH